MSEQPKPKREQLQMKWPEDRLDDPPEWPLAEGYAIRTARPGDAEPYAALLNEVGLGPWDAERATTAIKGAVQDGVIFAVHEADGDIVATAVAQPQPPPHHPEGGELGWVSVAKAHRGHGLGACVSAVATKAFLDAGIRHIYLRTDDRRMPAIKTYINLGFRPLLFLPDMEDRWRAVSRELKLDFETLGAIRKKH
jgi:mycothiol synthase